MGNWLRRMRPSTAPGQRACSGSPYGRSKRRLRRAKIRAQGPRMAAAKDGCAGPKYVLGAAGSRLRPAEGCPSTDGPLRAGPDEQGEEPWAHCRGGPALIPRGSSRMASGQRIAATCWRTSIACWEACQRRRRGAPCVLYRGCVAPSHAWVCTQQQLEARGNEVSCKLNLLLQIAAQGARGIQRKGDTVPGATASPFFRASITSGFQRFYLRGAGVR